MSMVIDSSIVLAWFFDDEKDGSAGPVLDMVAENGAWVPTIWRLEVANGFRQGIKRRRIDLNGREQALASLTRLNIAVDPDTNAFACTNTVELSDRFSLTAYDASYLELAHRRALPLATLDQELRAAAKKLGVVVL
jgi:predicted nucleic acid-binding protein